MSDTTTTVAPPDPERSSPSLPIAALQIFGLCGFAVAQPLFDLLGSNPTFFVAHRATSRDVAILLLVVLVGVPAVFIAVESMVRLLAPRAFPLLHAVLVGAVGALVLLPLIDRFVAIASLVAPALALIVMLLLVRVYRRVAGLRSFVTVLGPAPLVFVLMFVAVSPARSVFSEGKAAAAAAGVRPVPVFFLVFDQLPLGHLMNGDGEIATERFPNFARLARTSTWFRNATVVHPYTHKSVPAILSGRRSTPDDSPTLEHWPQNIFTLLQSSHEMRVVQEVTDLCPPRVCKETPPRAGAGLKSLFVDSALAYAHVAVPESWRKDLPSIGDRWEGFTEGVAPSSHDEPCDPDPQRITRTFEDWLVEAWSGEPPTLHYIHLLAPHRPWQYLPMGQAYDEGVLPGFTYKHSIWGTDTRLVERALQQQVLKLGYVDTLIGRFLDHLEDEDLLERASIVVTSDHGTAFTPGEHVRNLNAAIFEEAARVPLFFKAPGQTTGEIEDKNVETIDIVPTLADALGFNVPQPVDGQSMVDPTTRSRPEKYVVGGTPNRHWPPGLDRSFPVGAKMDRLFGRRTDKLGLFAHGPHRDLVGQPVLDLAVSTTTRQGQVADPAAFNDFNPALGCVPARVDGVIRPEHGGEVAVAVNGVIAGVGPAYAPDDGASKFIVMIRPDLLRAGDNDVTVYAVKGVGHERVLEEAVIERR